MEILNYVTSLFTSGFYFPGITFYQLVAGIGLGLVFGAIWYATYWTPILGKPSTWAVLSFSAFFTWIAVCFIQVPLQSLTTQGLNLIWDQAILMRFMMVAIIPQILYSGLVQEGAKLVPVVFIWRRQKKNITARTGLLLGAVSGLGFGVFEAIWVHNSVFISGWDLGSAVATTGIFYALLPFWERFFTVAFHTAVSAIAGWGLAKGKGWQFYLIASFTHAVLNYSVVLYSTGNFSQLQVSIYVAVLSVITAAVALWLRFRKDSK
jgi:RsiW-degrading membrane proteinase PrsW (M82 family)